MSYFENVNTRQQDTGDIDAFGRTRVSQITTQFDLKQLHDQQGLFVDIETNGSGSTSHSTTVARTQMNTSANGDWVVAQTKQRFNYQSGKSQLMFMTAHTFGATTAVTKRIGYFSSSTSSPYTADLDGLFFQSKGNAGSGDNGVTINIYQTGVQIEQTQQGNWNIDTMDGSGGASNPSGITVDWDNNQIFIVDFEWLGVGRVRWGLVIDGMIYYVHESDHANNTTDVYMSSPNQPLRWELRQDSVTAGQFTYVCASINSEGSLNKIGKVLSDNTGTTLIQCNSTSNKYALIGVGLQSTKVDTLVDIIDYSILATTSDNQLVEIYLNPTVAGTFTYNAVTNSSIETAIGSGASNTVTGGTLLFSQFVNSQEAFNIAIENAVRLGMTIAGTTDKIVLTTQPVTSNSRVIATVNWRELS